jgi:sec-independent protein translocase protein TatB
MIELSFAKLLLLAVIALVVLGPEKLPKAARMAGAMLRRVRLGWESVRSEVERELQMEEIRRAAREAAERTEAVQKSANEEMRSAHASVNRTLAEVAGKSDAVDETRDSPSPEARDGHA